MPLFLRALIFYLCHYFTSVPYFDYHINVMDILRVKSPLAEKTVAGLKAGTRVSISGVIYVARDAAHRRMVDALNGGQPLPFDIRGQTIYYMGPAPAKPGQVIGSAGPTTSSRMDVFTPRLLEAGLRAIIGKGGRAQYVRDALVKNRAVYLVTTGGASALLAKAVIKVEPVAYEDLGPEAIIKITVKDFPAIVADDIYGADLFEQGIAKYRRDR
jgi:fumarate hydratase subunit beta